ncbi:MAG TPA: hypothetical protein VN667_13970 [Burkholderiales bacterium]|nr:hypothetical protein [Burkholderiales bacterium]
MSNYALRIPDSLFEFAKKCAKEDNVSLNQFIVLALAEKVSSLKTAEFFEERVARARPVRLEKILEKAVDHPTVPGDELPASWKGFPKKRKRVQLGRQANMVCLALLLDDFDSH